MHQNEELPDIEFEFDIDVSAAPGWPNVPAGSPNLQGSGGSAPSTPGSPGANGPAPTWPFPTGTVPGGISWTTGSTSSSPGIIIPNSLKMNFIKPVPKTSVVYVIVFADNSTLMMQEQPVITPREMINIAKFINMVSNYCVAGIGGQSFDVKWSDLIMSLKIDKHFIAGPQHSAYDTTTDVLYVFLHDK